MNRSEREERDRLRETLRSSKIAAKESRPPSSGRGLHHVALLCSDIEATIDFYQGTLGFPLTEIFENRDYAGSTHFFFDIGNGNGLAFFDFPGLGLGPYSEVLGGLHHIAVSVGDEQWAQTQERLAESGIGYQVVETSLYCTGPDGERVELIADPLTQMYGNQVL